MTLKARSVGYWVTTGLIAFFIGGGGLAQVAQYFGRRVACLRVLFAGQRERTAVSHVEAKLA